MSYERLPTFFVLGAAKSGTTSLYYYIKQHPQIYLSPVKETHFFDNDENYSLGIDAYIEYFFKGAERFPARGDATPTYFHLPDKVAPRLAQLYSNQKPRFILIFRDPVARAWSHYLHNIRIQHEIESFEDALRLEEERLEKGELKWIGYYLEGLYAQQLKKWLTYFNRDQFFFLLNEDLRNDPHTTFQQLFDFIGVEDTFQPNTTNIMNPASQPRSLFLSRLIKRNSLFKTVLKSVIPLPQRKQISDYLISKNLRRYDSPPKISEMTDAKLRHRYAADILELAEIINRDLSAWLPKDNLRVS